MSRHPEPQPEARRPTRTFTAVVVDDEPAARDVIRTFLAGNPAVEVVGEADNGIEAVATVMRHRPDLLFLDVQMPDRDGFGVLEALGDAVPPGLVFVTAHDQHALRAFEVHAIDYLLKPFGRSRFAAALDKALTTVAARDALGMRRTYEALVEGHRSAGSPRGELMENGEPGPDRARRIGVRVGNRIVLVDLDMIEWVEADGDYVRLHTGGDIHLVSRSLRELGRLLGSKDYVRIHRSIIVRIDQVRELRRDPDGGGVVKLSRGVQLRVARGRWDQVEAALGLVG